MAVTRADSGTLSSGSHTVGTGYTTLSTRTAAGVYVCAIDLTNMVNGDVVEVVVENRVLAADGSNVECFRAAFADVQVSPLAILPAMPAVDNLVFKVRQLAGTARNFKWVVFTP